MDELTLIIENNKSLIYSVCKYFKGYNSMEDLFQVGCLGMIKAYKNYDRNSNCKFTTYAYPYIFGEMKKLVREDKGIKISREISKLNLKIERAYILLSQRLMKEPSISEIANYLEIPEYYVSEAILSLNKIKSIEEPISNNDNTITLEDVIGRNDNIDDLLILKDYLSKLTEEERNILENRYINDYTQSETAKLIGISQVQISRKENKAIEKVKRMAA